MAALGGNNDLAAGAQNPVSAPDQSAASRESHTKKIIYSIIQLLRSPDLNLKETEETLLRELQKKREVFEPTGVSDPSQEYAHYKSDGNPTSYSKVYSNFKIFVDSSLDACKYELASILFPLFLHFYLELVYNGHEEHAVSFMKEFRNVQEECFEEDLRKLAMVTKREHMAGNTYLDTIRSNKYVVRLSKDPISLLRKYISKDKKETAPLLRVFQEHIKFDSREKGGPRTRKQVESSVGSILGEIECSVNKAKIHYGLLKEPDLPQEEEERQEESEKPKKKKQKKELTRRVRNDPNAPPESRVPLPELRDLERMDRMNATKDARKCVELGAERLPSICFYSILNSGSEVTSMEIAEDGSLLAVGLSSSVIRVWSLTQDKLRALKSAEDLDAIDCSAEDIYERMMDNKNDADCRKLRGHRGPVYGVSFSSERCYLISGSEDRTVRLWSLLTWSNLVVYKAHCGPVWSAQFSPQGHYFLSGSHDRSAMFWSTEHHQPLRMFVDHFSDVELVSFHPNCNYVATASADRVVRLWDVVDGGCKRIFSGHKGSIHCLRFSHDGRFLVSAGVDKIVHVWDLAYGQLVAHLKGHRDTVYSASFSREGNLLATGGLDGYVKIWNFHKLTRDVDHDDVTVSTGGGGTIHEENYELTSYRTKSTPVLYLQFNRRNILLGAGPYGQV